MAESRRENLTENGEHRSFNIVTTLSRFADDNLNIFRNISTGLAFAGVIVIARSIKLTATFGCASEIPLWFIERNVSLRGRVRSVSNQGLQVDHVPIHVPLLSSLLTKRQPLTPLEVRLAGVELTPEGCNWLGQQLRPAEMVWLRLVGRQDETLQCVVSVSTGRLFSVCLNEELLQLGLGRATSIEGVDLHSRFHWRLQQRLLQAELRAEKRRRGLWREESLWNRVTRAVRDNMLVHTLKHLLGWTSRRKDQ
ncbi:protein C3orf33 homolog [Chanos chanos]|uniref:Protein C3orf33 homolog n=1 Tax=Chanos chanos TaxID=29144 RepID=A0A6J2UM60_CHACN|nr:protein C3orf33 homolog [Chanos chanos]